jgi:hypothetical protein
MKRDSIFVLGIIVGILIATVLFSYFPQHSKVPSPSPGPAPITLQGDR